LRVHFFFVSLLLFAGTTSDNGQQKTETACKSVQALLMYSS